ncbi:hypothetical protein [Actinomadura flavalba]|uniref:hypothetical protein n=1 Tax=Actinomadura flavalba TaxID=1120938 RepID=UPI00037FB011|nr:hypothetical protein [Actinomadura flavalba]
MTVNSRVALDLMALLTGAHDFSPPSAQMQIARSWPLAPGTGARQADRVFSDRRTLAASASENLDLAGVLTDAFGAVLTFARVRALMIAASASNTNAVVVGGAASNAWATPFGDASDKVNVRPGGALLLVAPDATAYAVTASTGDVLQVANGGSGTGVTYDVVILGASA